MSSAVRRSSMTRSRRRQVGSVPFGARRRCDSTSRMMWSTSTSSPPGAVSSASSSSNSSDSGFSLMLRNGFAGELTRAGYKRKGSSGAIPWRTVRHLTAARLFDKVVELKYRQQQRDDDEHDHPSHEHHHERPQQVGHGRQQPVHFALLIRRSPLEHLFQLAAAFAAADQVNHHGGEEFARGQRLADGGSLTNPQGGL